MTYDRNLNMCNIAGSSCGSGITYSP